MDTTHAPPSDGPPAEAGSGASTAITTESSTVTYTAETILEKVTLPKMPAPGMNLYYFIHMMNCLEFAKNCQMKRKAKNLPPAPRSEIMNDYSLLIELYSQNWWIDVFQPEYKRSRFTFEAVSKYEAILKTCALSSMYMKSVDNYFAHLDTQHPGLGLSTVTWQQRLIGNNLLEERAYYIRYAELWAEWFLIDFFTAIQNDDGYNGEGYESDDEGIDDAKKRANATRRLINLKKQFRIYGQDPEAYKEKRIAERDAHYANLEKNDREVEAARAQRAASGAALTMVLRTKGEPSGSTGGDGDAMDLD